MSEIDLKQQEGTETGAETVTTRRRRRSERYETEERADEARAEVRYTDRPALQRESETAREVARRFRQEEGNTTRIPMSRDGQGSSARARGGQIRLSQDGERRNGVRPDQAREGREETESGRAVLRGGSSRAAMSGLREGNGRPREHVGYAPGRMGMAADRGRMSEESRARIAEENRLRQGTDPWNAYPPAAEESRTGRPGSRKWLTAAVLTLLVIGAVLAVLLMMPEESPLGAVRKAASGLLNRDQRMETAVTGFVVSGQENALAPTEISFSIATRGSAEDVRLVDEAGSVIPTARTFAQSENGVLWNLIWEVEKAFQGDLRLQVLHGDAWQDTEKTVHLEILEPPAETPAEPTAAPTEIPVVFSTASPGENQAAANETESGELEETVLLEDEEEPALTEGEPDEISEEMMPQGEDAPAEAGLPVLEPVQNAAKAGEDGAAEEAGETREAGIQTDGEEPDGEAGSGERGPTAAGEAESWSNLRAAGDDHAEGTDETPEDLPAEDRTEDADGSETREEGTETTEKRAEEETADESAEAETARPKMTAAAAESADPGLISVTQIYNGTKKVREYARADREKVQMPTLGEYTRQKTGIFTFRGDAFRQNAAVGTVKGMDELEIIWTAEAGSVKGSGQTYYGVGWTGQPAIVKWGKEVREASDMIDSKKEKSGLREVIVAGLDGYLYFLDLVDGKATRNSIRLGYPMKGSPSVAPGGAPYMNVGQFARKMARGTGTIGIRQYNLYNNKELSLIDGLDAKNNRALNKVGSFETSALISRVSNVMVTAGTNGLLYVVNLNPEFDYVAGVYQQSPTFVLLRSKAKGESDAQTAVEASVAMYDHYVYYADMGGYLRCVDTNTMTVSWAVALGDAVESTPALDWHGENGLDLYCATELSIRKKGDAVIRCMDALSGEERWNVGIGVSKDKKNKAVISGFRASPVVGQQALGDYVYYTVNHLSDEGRAQLGLDGGEDAAVIALRKDSGAIVWAHGLSGSGYSSPVAVYDDQGNGSIIQCAGDGSVILLDGLTGGTKHTLQIDGTIEASPAVYNNIMVIATTERNKNNIYGIRIK